MTQILRTEALEIETPAANSTYPKGGLSSSNEH